MISPAMILGPRGLQGRQLLDTGWPQDQVWGPKSSWGISSFPPNLWGILGYLTYFSEKIPILSHRVLRRSNKLPKKICQKEGVGRKIKQLVYNRMLITTTSNIKECFSLCQAYFKGIYIPLCYISSEYTDSAKRTYIMTSRCYLPSSPCHLMH